jgi:hypothetical protein
VQHDVKQISSVSPAPPKWYFSTEPDVPYRLLQQLLAQKASLIAEIRRVAGPIAKGYGTSGSGTSGSGTSRRTKATAKNKLTVMCVNTGYLSLFLNWLCGCRKHGVDVSNLLVFASSPRLGKVLKRYGLTVIAHKAIGRYDEGRPDYYGDGTFINLMWLKTVSVFLALEAGFDVLFQDVDLVWFKDPWPELIRLSEEEGQSQGQSQNNNNDTAAAASATAYDTLWLDDGARSKRFAPLYANSGFFYFRCTTQSVMYWRRVLYSYGLISWMMSQQAVTDFMLGQHLRFGLKAGILHQTDFASGNQIGSPEWMDRYTQGTWKPLLIHVCWTANMKDKLEKIHRFKWNYVREDVFSDTRKYVKGTDTELPCLG